MATDSKLHLCRRPVFPLAERDAVWHPQRQSVSARSAAGAAQQPLCEDLQRSEGGRREEQHGTASGQVATFYANITPTGVFNSAARQISPVQGKSLSQNAHDLALINMAISDAAVATFYAKYFLWFWGPTTAIPQRPRMTATTKPIPTNYAPFIVTPCFPGYPSAHGTLSNSARRSAGTGLWRRSLFD